MSELGGLETMLGTFGTMAAMSLARHKNKRRRMLRVIVWWKRHLSLLRRQPVPRTNHRGLYMCRRALRTRRYNKLKGGQ